MRFVFLYIILIQNVYGSLTLKYQLKSWANNALLTSAVSGITLLEECVVKKLYNYLPTRLESVLEKSSFDIDKNDLSLNFPKKKKVFDIIDQKNCM